MNCATSPNVSPSACRPSGLPAFKKSGAQSTGGLGFAEAVEAFERNLLNDALQRSGGNLTQASQELGMAKTTLFDKVKKYGLSH